MTTEKPVTSVKVRMYSHGFGDCFLISFFQEADRVFTMLIDCGIKHNTTSETVPIEAVIDDLKKLLTPAGGDRPALDVLVATHEHWDHIAFFHPKRFPDFFGDFIIGQVWLAWTENPKDAEAVTINSRLRSGAAALQVAAAHLKVAERDETKQLAEMSFGESVAHARKNLNKSLDDVLGFYGVAAASKVSESGIKYKTNGNVSIETEVAIAHIVDLGKHQGGVKYFSPGTMVDERVLPKGVNVYVMGPPRGSLINQSNPSGGKAKETYLGIDNSGLTGFIDGLLHLGADQEGGSGASVSTSGPFAGEIGITEEAAKADPYFKSTYFANKEKYRRIEFSWLDVAGQFALQLDGAINNTSLVLAIELAETGKVLLFPGDAQVGSWLSWHQHEWTVKRGSKTETRTAEDLLKNTVLYKVSHHGSHNATIKGKGLELMVHPDLVAMMPEKEDCYNGIPYPELMEHLNERCKGRVLVSADVNFPPEDLLKKRPPGLSAAEWKAFKNDVVVDPIFIEYTVR